jgi:hypothetical protein
MHSITDFLTFLFWLLKTTFFILGFGLGATLALLLTPVAFRRHRRAVLRRKWKADKPREVTEGLFPEWQDYDPDMPGIAKRCVCHGRKIHPGERVLTWPETGPMNLLHVAVYCETVKERLWDGP